MPYEKRSRLYDNVLSRSVPGHEDVDESFVGVELGGDVVLDPLVDGLGGGVGLDLLQKLLLQLHQREQEAQPFALQDLQHPVLVLVDLWQGGAGIDECHDQLYGTGS